MLHFVIAAAAEWTDSYLAITVEDKDGEGMTTLCYDRQWITLSAVIGISEFKSIICGKNSVVWKSSHGAMISDGRTVRKF